MGRYQSWPYWGRNCEALIDEVAGTPLETFIYGVEHDDGVFDLSESRQCKKLFSLVAPGGGEDYETPHGKRFLVQTHLEQPDARLHLVMPWPAVGAPKSCFHPAIEHQPQEEPPVTVNRETHPGAHRTDLVLRSLPRRPRYRG